MSPCLYWGKDKVLSKKMFEENGNKFVFEVWCKIGAKYKWEILSTLRGFTKKASVAFIDGTDKVFSIF